MAENLELDVLNPFLEDEGGPGEGYKVFGKKPRWPETLEDAKQRYCVRIENYIEQSQKHQRNFILVTHADAVAAVLAVFQRGLADIESMDFCARVIAQRNKADKRTSDTERGVYSDKWTITHKAINAEVFHDEKMAKYYEKQHLEQCEEMQQAVVRRKTMRSKTDDQLERTLSKFDARNQSKNSKDAEK